MQMSRKIIKKYPITSPYDWLVRHYSFNLPLTLKSIAHVPNAHTIRIAITLRQCMA